MQHNICGFKRGVPKSDGHRSYVDILPGLKSEVKLKGPLNCNIFNDHQRATAVVEQTFPIA